MTVETTERALDLDVAELLQSILRRRDASSRTSTLGAGGYDIEAGRSYLRSVLPLGLAVPTWPATYGGRNADAKAAARITSAQEPFEVPDLYPFRVGLKMVGPTLLEHGTPAQQARWLHPIAAGTEIWCQMFSEPDAGSDLANVGTIARSEAGGWSLTGQKVWTSRAAYSDWGICLARSDAGVPKHRGMTMFAVRMDALGVDVRPLRQMNGDDHFSEVFLSEVTVPDDCRIGAVGDGWKVAVTLLAHERAGADRRAPVAVGGVGLPVWLDALARSGALTDPITRDRAMALLCHERAVLYTQLRSEHSRRTGAPGPETSGLKLHGAATFKRRVDLLADAAGARALLTDWDGHVDFLTGPSMSIRGGSDEIQRNVVAERVLGLPPEPRADRDLPWSVSRRGG